MIKGAQKRSMDPVQQRLRQSKATWNKDVSAFINDLIHLKKLMNGWPNKFHKERSRITEPVPADPATILGSLAGDFAELAQRGNALVQQQAGYSQTRRRPQPKAPEAPGPTTPATPAPAAPATPPAAPAPAADLTKQLAASLESKYELVAEGSNPFTRLWTRIKTPRAGFGSKAQVRRLRMDMLGASLKSYRALGRLQVQVTKSSKQSVMDAYKEMKAAWDEWSIVSRNFNIYAGSLPGQPERPEQMREEGYSPEKEEAELVGTPPQGMDATRAKQIMSDVRDYGPFFNTDKEAAKLLKALSAVKIQETWAPRALEGLYNNLISYLNQSMGTGGSSLQDIYQQSLGKPAPAAKGKPKPVTPSQRPLQGSEPPEAAPASDQLEVTAQAFLRKWLGKTRHQALPGRSSGLRIQVFDLAASARKNIDQAMDMLEKGLDVDVLGPKIYEVTKQINSLRSLMRSLHNVERPKGKGAPSPLEGIF